MRINKLKKTPHLSLFDKKIKFSLLMKKLYTIKNESFRYYENDLFVYKINKEAHRVGKPALLSKKLHAYFLKGKISNYLGPAIINADYSNEYLFYINNINYRFKEWYALLPKEYKTLVLLKNPELFNKEEQ